MIRAIRFNRDALAELGLQTAELTDLGPVVVLAGPNGGGKSRYLRLIAQIVADAAGKSFESQLMRSLTNLPFFIQEGRLKQVHEMHHEIKRDDDLDLAAPMLLRISDLLSLDSPTGQSPDQYGDDISWERPRQWRDYLFGRGISEEWDQRKIGSADELTRLTDALLGLKLEVSKEIQSYLPGFGPPNETERRYYTYLLGGRRYNHFELSEGQLSLLTWISLFHTTPLTARIVLIDEPESYLHPDACWRALQMLRDLVGTKGQLWIATHSLPLVAQFGVDALHYVENGRIARATRTPSRVWQSLLGGDGSREKLLEFLDGDGALAAARFASECLIPPGVVGAQGKGDPQAAQLSAVVIDWLTRGCDLSVLEYGAGKGRLVAAMADTFRDAPDLPAVRLRYVAYNKRGLSGADEGAECVRAIEGLMTAGARGRYTEDLADLQARNDDKVDVIVLANVLHEVPVDEWLALFANLWRCARPGAVALVIEDQELRVGEQPHPRGFLILERNEWRALCDAEIGERREQRGGRDLTAFAIPLEALARTNTDRLDAALALVIDRCAGEVLALRSQPLDDHRAGRKHAFFALMHLNATLARKVYSPSR